ncbi:MAG: type IA DNA topoisomerase [Candidatus Thalassarchaeum sp.]
MKLMILESGAKARTVKSYLGKGWIVEACNGHVQDLPSGNGSKQRSKAMWAANKGELPDPPWDWTDGAQRVINKILAKARKSDVEEVYIATDPDREGEFIAWRLSILFSEFSKVNRVTFNEITKSAVSESISNPSGINSNLVDAAKVRRFMDRLVGYRCSRFSKSWRLTSMGRVQTPTLGFIVEREIEREAHVPIEYHSVHAGSHGIKFNVRFHEKGEAEAWFDDSGKHRADRTSDSDLATSTFDAITSSDSLVITSVKEGITKRNPKPPFTTDTMLQAGNSTLGWSVSKTSRIASSLYQSGFVTYIRTDSTRTNPDARKAVRQFIRDKYGEEHLGKGVVGKDVKSKANVQDAHEAIRPSKPDVLSINASADEKRLYSLIWARFAASQMSQSIRERRELEAMVPDCVKSLRGTASWRTHSGWEAVFDQFNSNVRTTPPAGALEEQANWPIEKNDESPKMVTDHTKPPGRYTESSIVQAMKKAEIGRPSTYVSTILKLTGRGYVESDGGSLKPTNDGRMLWLDVVPFYNNQDEDYGLFTPNFTSKMEGNLDLVENGTQNGPEIWDSFVIQFRDMHNNALDIRKKTATPRQRALIESRLVHLQPELIDEVMSSKTVDEITGDEARVIIDRLKEIGDTVGYPPSEKQSALILKLADQIGIGLDGVLEMAGVSDISALTGGSSGTASELIGTLIEKSKELPATASQVDLIGKLAEQNDKQISELLTIVGARDISELTKNDASTIISKMKGRSRGRRRKKKS